MKTYLLIALLALVWSVSAKAGIKVTQGSKKFLKKAKGTVVLVFDWEGATYDDKMPLEEKFTNLEELKPVAWKGFRQNFNRELKKLKVEAEEEGAKFKFSMKVTKMDQYVNVFGFVPSPAIKVWGMLTVTDLESGEEVAVIEVSGVDGGANPAPTERFSDCFEELGEEVAELR